MTIEKVKELALELYGLEVEVKQLDGYEDLNFMLKTKTGKRFIFKKMNVKTTFYCLTAQHEVLGHLQTSKQAAIFPKVILSKDAKDIISFEEEKGMAYIRLLSFLEGEFLANTEQNDALLQSFGRVMATMNKELLQVEIPSLAYKRDIWDLKHFSDIEDRIEHIADPYLQTVVRHYLLQFQLKLEPILKDFRHSIIHGDANDWNVLVRENEVTGMIDFGDLAYSPLICDLAVAIAYLVMHKEEPIHVVCQFLKTYHQVLPLEEKEIDALYYLIAGRLSTTTTMAAYSAQYRSDNAYLSVSEEGAINALLQWIKINPIHAQNSFRKACGIQTKQAVNHEAFWKKRNHYFSKAMSISYKQPIKMESAALQYMYDDKGDTYLDCVNNICHVGHCHPKVVKAGQAQLAVLNTNTRYFYDSLNEYAKMLSAKFPAPLSKVFFVNSGSAATDLAYRLAVAHTNRKDIIVVDHAYHGNTLVGIELSPYKHDGKGGKGTQADIHKTSIPDLYRGKYKYDDNEAGKKYAEEVKDILQKNKEAGKPIAAFFCESILGCGGQVLLPSDYLTHVYKHVREAGGVCVADEVQVGFGRVGSHFWGFELSNVVPDIVIMGKPIGNGHPMAAVITTDEIAKSFENGMEFFSSFGGNPVSCEIGKAVLRVIEEEKLQENALKVGNYLLKELEKFKEEFDLIGDVRGAGLFLGIELVKDRTTLEPDEASATAVINYLKGRKIMLSTDGPYHNVLKFKPPIIFTMENAETLLRELRNVFQKLNK